MCRSIFQILFGILAAIFLSLGITLFLSRIKLLDEQTFLTSLSTNNAYSVVLKNISNLFGEGSDQAKIIGTSLAKNPEIVGVIQKTVEESAKYIFAWIRDEEKEVFVYVPNSELQSLLSTLDIENLIKDVVTEASLNYSTLPECTQVELQSVSNPEDSGEEVDPANFFTTLDCRIPGIETQEELINSVTSNLNVQNGTSFDINQLFQQNLTNLNGKTAITKLFENDPVQQSKVNESLVSFKNTIYNFGIFGVALIIIGLSFTLLSLAFARHNFRGFALTFLNITWLSGFIIFCLSSIPLIFFKTFSLQQIKILFEDPKMLEDSLKTIQLVIEAIIMTITTPTIAVGTIMFIGGILLTLLVAISTRTHKLEKDE